MAKKIFFPNLDGWRFLAFFGVFYYHSFSTELAYIKDDPIYQFLKWTKQGGEMGVDFFFVLSGFLIVYLLISEKALTGKISVKKFYLRRILRIFPLYYFCVFFGFVLFPFFKQLLGAVPDENAHWQFYLAFLANIDIVRNGALPDAGILGILWSVAIEEQFYLTIPFVLLLVPVKYYKWVFFAVLVFSWIMRAQYYDNYYFLKFHTFASVGNLAIGGLIAYYSANSERFLTTVENLNPWIIRATYAAVILIFFFRDAIFAYPPTHIFDTSLLACLFAVIILEQNYAKRSDFKMKNNRFFTNWGKYTYGLYCLHMIAAIIVLQITARLGLNKHLWQVVLIETPLIFVTSLLIAYLSYTFYESPFLRLKKRFAVFEKAPPETS